MRLNDRDSIADNWRQIQTKIAVFLSQSFKGCSVMVVGTTNRNFPEAEASQCYLRGFFGIARVGSHLCWHSVSFR